MIRFANLGKTAAVAALAGAFAAPSVLARDPAGNAAGESFGVTGRQAREFPSEAQWSDGASYVFSRMYGKVIVLYLFNARRNGIGLITGEARGVATRYAGKPLLVLGVSDEGTLADARKASLTLGFPVLADPLAVVTPAWAMTFGAWGLNRSSYTYRRQAAVRVVGPDGIICATVATDEVIRKALEEAEWKYGDRKWPSKMKRAIRLLEFGLWERAIPHLVSARKSGGTSEVAAEEFLARFEEDASGELGKAKVFLDTEMFAEAYFAHKKVAEAYKGLKAAKDAAKVVTSLKSIKEVKTALRAMKIYDLAVKMLQSGRRQKQKTGLAYLNALIAKYPDSRAARKAGEYRRYANSLGLDVR